MTSPLEIVAEISVLLDDLGVAYVLDGSFNLLHSAAAMKVDVFVLGDKVLHRNQIERRVQIAIQTEPPTLTWITSPEDQILRKLDWYRLGGQVSDRQWRDITAILRVQRDPLDDEITSTPPPRPLV